jgi:hypothetical protein
MDHTAPRAGYPGTRACGTNQCTRSFYARTVGVVNLKKIVGFLVIALVVFYIFTQPNSAATSLESIGTTLRNGAESVIEFFNQLVQ